MDHLLGGYGETQEATEEIQKICDQVKPQVEQYTKKIYDEFTAVEYRKQIVSGSNFLIKVHVGGQNYIIIKVFRELPCNGGKLELLAVKENQHKEDPIIPF